MSKKAARFLGNRAVKSHIIFAILRSSPLTGGFFPLFTKNAAAGLGKIFLCKIHALDPEGLSVEIFQAPCLSGEGEGQLVGIERLIGAVKALIELAILAVAQQGVTGVGELGADLVGPAGDQLTLH